MGISKGSAPPRGDPAGIASAQTSSNLNTAIGQAALNNVNQVTPYGSLTYTHKPGIDLGGGNVMPQYTATQTLSPEQQKLYDTQTAVTQGAYDLAKQYTGRIADATSKPFSYEGLPEAPVYDENARIAARDRIISRDQPQMDRDREAVITRLANQGITPGSEAYTQAMDQHQRSVNDYRLGADQNAFGEASSIFGIQGTQRDRAIQEMANLRSQPINEVAALLGTGNGVRDPSFVNTPQTQIAPTDVAGIYGNDQAMKMAAWQQQSQQQAAQQQALISGIFGLGGAALGGWGMSGFGMGGGGGGMGAGMGRSMGRMMG